MAIRDVYLKIEQVVDYSTVEPEQKVAPPKIYRRDCMRQPGHENSLIPSAEVEARRLTALVYREYLDPNYLIPKPDKLIAADVNEPVFSRRVPGTVIYANPGDRLRIHVFNADLIPHSFHAHGLAYGIDSDGAWPFGTQSTDGRRSDEICPAQRWTYTYDVTEEMVGAWPFHDHSSRMISESVNRGLFGGIVVRPRRDRSPLPALELPSMVSDFLRTIPKWVPDAYQPPLPHPGPDPGPFAQLPAGPGAPAGMPAMPGMAAAGAPLAIPAAGGGMAMAALPQPAGKAPDHGHEAPPEVPSLEAMQEFQLQLDAVNEFLEEWSGLTYVHPRPRPRDVIEVPLFFHYMAGKGGTPAFNSGPLAPGSPPYEVIFGGEGSFAYHCNFHPNMQGTITVAMGGPSQVTVNIQDAPTMQFNPAAVTVAPGGKVSWTQSSNFTHTVTENAGGLPSWCLNGRSFVGNTPTIVAEAGQKIRWYVFNLDLGMNWHNFHPHGQRFQFAGETVDIRSIGPAESFVVETTAPRVLTLPPAIEATQPPKKRPRGARLYRLRGEFLVHCHVEMHMMAGLAGLVRSYQDVWLTPKQAETVRGETGLPLDPGGNECPAVDYTRCDTLGCGEWVEVAGLPGVTFMHAALVPKHDKILFWGYDRADQSRLYDYGGAPGYSVPANQPVDVSPTPGSIPLSNIWSAEHAYQTDGTLLAHGGFTPRQSYLFDPGTLKWSRTRATAQDRFYSTTLALEDGKIMTLYGSASKSLEVYDPLAKTWSAPKAFPAGFNYVYYPWTYLLPGGDLFIAGHQGVTRRFDWKANPIVDDPAKRWNTIAGERSTGGEKGTSVLFPLRPPLYHPRVLIAAGDPGPARQTSEMIDLSAAVPAWTALPNLNAPHPEQVQSVLLPDGKVLLCGGIAGADGGPAEILDLSNPGAGWTLCANMKHPRGYHSAAILLADGSVMVGGDPPGGWAQGANIPNERYYPAYCFLPRPTITNAPAMVGHGANFTINTPDATSIAEVVLLRPGAVTHGFNMSQRFVGCQILGNGAGSVQVKAPPDGTVAPPGPYLLFIVTAGRIPSVGRWIAVS